MGRQTETREIDGLVVTTTQLPPMRAYATMARLGKVLGPALGELSSVNTANLAQQDASKLGPALGALLSGLSEDVPLVLKVLEYTSVDRDGKRVTLDSESAINSVFYGKFMAMLATIKFALEVNYGSFLDGGLASLQGAGEATENP